MRLLSVGQQSFRFIGHTGVLTIEVEDTVEPGVNMVFPCSEVKKTELATAYPECRLVAAKETMTVEGIIKIVYDLLKDKLNIVKLTFTSGVNAAIEEYEPRKSIDRCPLCGIVLNENGACPKCGYKK